MALSHSVLGINSLQSEFIRIQGSLYEVMIFAFAHEAAWTGTRPRAAGTDLEDAIALLHIERDDVRTEIRQHPVSDQDPTERVRLFLRNAPQRAFTVAVNREKRMVAGDDLVTGIGLGVQRGVEPRALDVAVTA